MVHQTISSYCINKTAGIFSLTFFIIIKTYGTRPVKKQQIPENTRIPRSLLGGVVFAGPATVREACEQATWKPFTSGGSSWNRVAFCFPQP
jgi:hypothetical protein